MYVIHNLAYIERDTYTGNHLDNVHKVSAHIMYDIEFMYILYIFHV